MHGKQDTNGKSPTANGENTYSIDGGDYHHDENNHYHLKFNIPEINKNKFRSSNFLAKSKKGEKRHHQQENRNGNSQQQIKMKR